MLEDWLTFLWSHGVPQLIEDVLIFSGLDAADVMQVRLVCKRYKESVDALVLRSRFVRAVFSRMIRQHKWSFIANFPVPDDSVPFGGWPVDYWEHIRRALQVIFVENGDPLKAAHPADVAGIRPPLVRVLYAEFDYTVANRTFMHYAISRDIGFINQYARLLRGEDLAGSCTETEVRKWRKRRAKSHFLNEPRSRQYKRVIRKILRLADTL